MKILDKEDKELINKYGGAASTVAGAATGGFLGSSLGVGGSIAGFYIGVGTGILPVAVVGGAIGYLAFKGLKYKARSNELKKELKKSQKEINTLKNKK